MVANEALVLGVPVITTNYPSAYDIVSDNVNGIICKNSIQSLYETLNMLFYKPELLEKLKKNASDFIYDNEKILTLDNITLNHYPDKTKSRKSYLPLLKLAVKEDPTNDRNMHYLGREYMYYNENDKAIKILKKHLKFILSGIIITLISLTGVVTGNNENSQIISAVFILLMGGIIPVIFFSKEVFSIDKKTYYDNNNNLSSDRM